MTREQAIKILEEATGLLKLTRQEHNTVVTALQLLIEQSEPKQAVKEEKRKPVKEEA